MKEFLGKNVEFVVEGFPAPFSAKVVNEDKQFVLVKGKDDEFARRIVKSKIVSFMPLEKVDKDVDLEILICENPSIGCPGVQYVKEGKGFTQKDFETFMIGCTSRCGTCRTGTMGNLRTANGKRLSEMLSGMLFGNYPEKAE